MNERTTGQARSHQHIQDVERAKIIKYICKAKELEDCTHANVCGLITVLEPNNQVMLPYHRITLFFFCLF